MASQFSPFLQRSPVEHEVRRAPAGDARFERALRDREVQRLTLEKLRYLGYVRNATLASTLQRLGDVGRRHGWLVAAVLYGYFLTRLL